MKRNFVTDLAEQFKRVTRTWQRTTPTATTTTTTQTPAQEEAVPTIAEFLLTPEEQETAVRQALLPKSKCVSGYT